MPNSADHGRADDRDPAAAAAGRDGAAGWPGPVSAWADHGPAVVAFGGGHGLAASLAALRRLTDRLTAVVTVGDDGGSSGRLRAELGALPPGDLRMALAALAGPDPWSRSWTELFQRRFEGDGPLAGHAVGNLVLAALAEHVGSPVAALELAAQLLGVHGRVLPLSEDGIDIVAEVAGLDPADPAAAPRGGGPGGGGGPPRGGGGGGGGVCRGRRGRGAGRAARRGRCRVRPAG
ncbi:2-phospho-L-lactate transferase CofD family protein, partial [Frankia sp. AgW1.1]|uniref:gluconeogenesis factor YvcK family protein n=1 Tax=Frankia sp. AgW1.1 TaxID=1836971 RepID=UPI0035ABA072